MADISVTLGLDDRDYTAKLLAAGKNADSFGTKTKAAFEAGSKGAETMAGGAEVLNKKLEGMTSLIVGVGFAEFVKQAVEAGSVTAELAKAMGVATSTLFEMQLAAVPAGMSTEKLGAMMSKMEINAQAAVEGNLKLRDSFNRLGVSTDYMRTHSADEVFNQIAKSLAGITSPAQRAALAMEVLGKGAKFADWKEYDENLRKTIGTQTEAGDVMDKSKEIMDKLALKAMLVKSEFLKLIEPLLTLIGEKGFGGAKLAAEALGLAMAGFVGSKIISGISAIGGMFKSLATTFGITTSGAVAATMATEATAISLKDAALSAAFLTGSMERVGRATAAVASAELIVNKMLEAGVVESIALTQATNALAAARERLVIATEAAVITQGEMTAVGIGGTAATIASTTAITAQVGILARIAAGFSALLAPIAAFAASAVAVVGLPFWAIIAGLAVIIGGLIIVWRAFGDVIKHHVGEAFDWVGKKASALFDWINDGLDGMANGLRKMAGIPLLIGKEGAAQAAANTNPTDARLAMKAQSSPGLVAANDLNPQLVVVQGLRNQAEAMALVNRRTLERLSLELQLVSASEAVRKEKLADFDTTTATLKEEQRIRGEIKRLTIEDENTKGASHADEIKFLNQQLGMYKQQASAVAERTKSLVEAQNKEAMSMMFAEQKVKVQKNIQDLTSSIEQLSMSADERKLNDIQKQINAEVELATKKRQAQLGSGETVSDKQIAEDRAKITATYQGQIEAQQKLNTATKEYNDLLFGMELSNKLLDDKIHLTSQLDQLTMTNNEKIIRQMEEQRDLAIRAEITKRESQLAPGQHLDASEVQKVTQQISASYQVQMDGAQQTIDKSREWSTGWSAAFKQYAEDQSNMASKAKQTFDSMTGNMNSAIDNFVMTGKFSMADFTKSVIQDLIKIELKAMAMEALKGLFGSGGSGGGLLSTLGSFLGGLFAEGGDPPVGKASIVGEKGPEVFIPKTAGTIIPNNKLGGVGAGQIAGSPATVNHITNNHYSVNAVDAKSVAQLFAENRKQLLGTVRMAQAEQPFASPRFA